LIVQTILEGLCDPDAIRDLTDPPDADDQGRSGAAEDARALLARQAPLILSVLAAAEPLLREQLAAPLKGMSEHGWGGLVGAIERLLEGERRPDTLTAGLDAEDTLIVHTLLTGLADPQAVTALLSGGPGTP
jgi:hypothetical protein